VPCHAVPWAEGAAHAGTELGAVGSSRAVLLGSPKRVLAVAQA